MQTEEEILFHSVCSANACATKSTMFGVQCYKINRKPFVMFYDNEIVCKLYHQDHDLAMLLSGAKLFNPMNNGKPMKNWVHIPFAHREQWPLIAQKAYEHVLAETNG
jgi:hypothetical protein